MRRDIEKVYLPIYPWVHLQCHSDKNRTIFSNAVDHLIPGDSDMSRDPHQTDFKLIRAQPPQHFLALIDNRIEPKLSDNMRPGQWQEYERVSMDGVIGN
jgi:hypothetical protein